MPVAFNQASYTIVTKANVSMQERQKANELCLMFRHVTTVHVRYVCVHINPLKSSSSCHIDFKVEWLIHGVSHGLNTMQENVPT